MAVVWIVCIFMYTITFEELPTFRVVIWVSVMVLVFSIGAIVDPWQLKPRSYEPGHLIFIRNVCILLLPFQLSYLYECLALLFSYGTIGTYLQAVRLAALSREPLIEDYAFYLQINTTLSLLSLFGIAVALLFSDYRGYKKQFYFFYLLTMVVSVIDGSRSVFMVGMLALAAINLATGHLKATLLLTYGAVMFLVFVLTFSLFRFGGEDIDFIESVRFSLVYICGTVGLMDPALTDSALVYWQDLEAVSNKLAAIGLPVETYDLKSLQADYFELPLGFNGNVYSAFGVYYQYMGILGSIVFVVVTGWLCGVLYRNRQRSPAALTYYSLFWPAIVLTPFHDYFIQQGYSILKLSIYIFLLRVLQPFVGTHLAGTNIFDRGFLKGRPID